MEEKQDAVFGHNEITKPESGVIASDEDATGETSETAIIETSEDTEYKEKYFHYANIFNETADNELRHAKVYLKLLTEGGVNTSSLTIDPGILSPTVDTLAIASHEEEVEGVEMYTEAAKVADEEGFADIADVFRAIASIEMHHKERFDKMRQRILDGTVWKSEKPVKWQCLVCGYIHEGTEPPKECPACAHPYQHFMRAEDNV